MLEGGGRFNEPNRMRRSSTRRSGDEGDRLAPVRESDLAGPRASRPAVPMIRPDSNGVHEVRSPGLVSEARETGATRSPSCSKPPCTAEIIIFDFKCQFVCSGGCVRSCRAGGRKNPSGAGRGARESVGRGPNPSACRSRGRRAAAAAAGGDGVGLGGAEPLAA